MRVLTDPTQFSSPGAVVAIGMFDGVHSGHRRVLTHLRELGLRHKVPTLVLTFDPHPRVLFDPKSAPKLLCSLADRVDLLAATRVVDYCLVLPFDRRRSQEPVEDFVRQALVEGLGARALVVGENFACGQGRHGNVQRLQTLGAQFGFDVHALALRTESDPAGAPHCSSTEARRLIQAGDVKRAAFLLGRPHELVGQITGDPPALPHSGEAELPQQMCAPSVGAYIGLVRHERQDAHWIRARLQVHETRSTKRRSVHYLADDTVGAHFGDHVSVRFLAKADASAGHSVSG